MMASSGRIHLDRALGAFLGALCGDAAGATLEFFHGMIQLADVDLAVTMPGGGVFSLGPGQITDDSELALSLARGLVDRSPRDGFPAESVARQYADWMSSKPFDCGGTCGAAFGVSPDVNGDYARLMMASAAQYSVGSEANGSLMRIVPLALWSAGEPEDTIASLARAEALLSHPSDVCQDCNAVYCLLIDHLLRFPSDADGAIARADRFVRANVHTRVREWFLDESLSVDQLDCTRQIGHVRWGFVLAVHFLRTRTPYESAIRQTLIKGGDTDTNAAIVGGVIGALHGLDAIPSFMREPVLAFDPSAPGATRRPRPDRYRGANMTELAKQIVGDKIV